MKYYLILGYRLVGKYKNFPTVRVQVNGKLVDEFECDNEEDTEISSQLISKWQVSGICEKLTKDFCETIKYTTPTKCRTIELDSSTWLDDGEIVLSALNNNSNYNNGFMTKGSQIWFTPVILIRKDLYDNESVLHRIIKKLHHARTMNRQSKIAERKWDSKVRHKWPGFNTYPDRRLSNLGSAIGNVNLFQGGNFEIKFNIKKKHKTHMLVEDDVPLTGYFYMDRFFETWCQHHRKKYFEMGTVETIDRDTGVVKFNTFFKEKSKQINIKDED